MEDGWVPLSDLNMIWFSLSRCSSLQWDVIRKLFLGVYMREEEKLLRVKLLHNPTLKYQKLSSQKKMINSFDIFWRFLWSFNQIWEKCGKSGKQVNSFTEIYHVPVSWFTWTNGYCLPHSLQLPCMVSIFRSIYHLRMLRKVNICLRTHND